MSFKVGKFYAIQGQDRLGVIYYLEVEMGNVSKARLRSIARKAGRSNYGSYSSYNDDEYESQQAPVLSKSTNPFGVKLFPDTTDFSIVMKHLVKVSHHAIEEGIDPNSLKIVVINTSVETFIPEEQSPEEVELRKFALSKLSAEERKILKVDHWEVYHKLGDRSMLDDDNA